MKEKATTTSTRGKVNEEVGIVVSNKMHKTISVEIPRTIHHKKYGKILRRFSVFKAHDENNTANIGDTVVISESRPLSKTKRWRLVKILTKATDQGALHDTDAK